MSPLIEIELTYLQKSGGAKAPRPPSSDGSDKLRSKMRKNMKKCKNIKYREHHRTTKLVV